VLFKPRSELGNTPWSMPTNSSITGRASGAIELYEGKLLKQDQCQEWWVDMGMDELSHAPIWPSLA